MDEFCKKDLRMKKPEKAIGSVDEEEIIKKIISGETILFEILMRRTNGLLYKIAKMYGFSSNLAEDIVQEVHITALAELKNFKHRSLYKTWVSKIMINKCNYELKHGRFKKELLLPSISETQRPIHVADVASDRKLINEEFLKILEVCVQNIPLIYRTVFVLREVEEYSVSETAELLEISHSNVKVRLNRAKVLLRNEFEKYYSPSDLFDIKLDRCDDIVTQVFNKLKLKKLVSR